jgi:RNA polymerase sigma-70 factor (ECF subfamily)
MTEARMLQQAVGGDESAFGKLVEPHRQTLQAHCYRMLGSVADAEDAMQETLLAAWRGMARFEGRSSLRAWLFTIATNVCLKAIERRPKRVLPLDYGPPGDPHDPIEQHPPEITWIDPYPDEQLGLQDGLAGPEARYEQREGVELAFIAAVQLLPARQRAVLLLRDVLGFSGHEVAEALEASPTSVYSALQRAHVAVAQRVPAHTQQATLRSLGDEKLRQIVDRYVKAWESDDVDAIAAMLTADATLSMPPTPSWYRGPEDVAACLRAGPLAGRVGWKLIPVRANGQLAVGSYRVNAATGVLTPHGVTVLTLDGERIAAITAFHDAEAPARFGLPGLS